jgi:hypothetical protein
MTAEERREVAKKAAAVRWAQYREKKKASEGKD